MSELAATGGEGVGPVEERIVVRRRVNWPARIAKLLLGLIVALLLLVAMAFVGINTDPGRRFLADRIEALEFANGMKIGVGRIEGSVTGALTIRRFTLSDPKGVFFGAPLVRLDWRPFAYLDNHVDIRSLTAPTATLARLPEFRASPPTDGPLLPDLDIDVGQLKIERLEVGPSVTGERRIGFVEGSARIADRRAQVALQASVFGGEGRAGGDRLTVRLDAVPDDNRLAINAFASAPAGGVLAKIAGIEEPLIVRLQGSGDWKKWDGRLFADLANAPFARLALSARDGRFGVRGPTRVARLVEGPTTALLGPITNVAVDSSWENRRADLRGRFTSDAFTLDAEGVADLGRSRFDDLRLGFALLKPQVLAPNLAGRDLRVAATINGDLRRPEVDYRVSAATVAFNDMALQGLIAEGVARFDREQLLVPIAARARAITGLDTVAGGTLLNVRLDGDLAVDWPRIVSDNIRIRSDRVDAKAIILADVGRGLYTGALEGRINNYRVDSLGIFNVTTDADLKYLPGGGVGLVGRVRAQSTRLFNEGVRDFLGGNLVASSDVAYGADGLIRFTRLRMTSPNLRVTDGRGFYSPDGRIAVTASGVSRQYGPVGVEVTGTASSPRATVSAARPGFGLGIAGLRAEIRNTGNAYAILARGRSDYGDFTADVSVLAGSGPLTIDIRRATLAGITASGRVRQTPAGPYAGELRASGQGIGGFVRLSAAGRYQQALVNLRARNAVLPEPAGIAVGAAIVDARIILYDQPEIVADAQLAQARIGMTDLSAFRAIINYRGGRGFARGVAEGSSGVPFRLAFNSELTPNLWRAALKGRVNGVDVRTESPARIVPRAGSYRLLPTRLLLDEGSARVAGSFGDELRLQSRIDGVNLTVVNIFAPGLGLGGRATGSIDFAQRGDALPTLDASLAVRGLTRTTAASVSRPLDANIVARLSGAAGTLNAVLRTRGTVVGRVQAATEPAGGGSWTERIARAPLRGGIRFVGPADALFSLAGLADQSLSGPLGVAADFSGRVEQPSLQGIVRGRNLTYTNATYGTRLTDLALQGRFTGERLQIDQLTARAGSGTVRGSGFVSLAAASGYPADFDLTLDNARLANSDALRVTATGDVKLIKAANESPVLRGTVRLPATRYQIVRESAAQVPALTGVRFKPPRGRPIVTGDAPPPSASASFSDVRLDLNIVAPGELFVSGMGLESEWRANLRVTGSSQDPRVAGSVDLVRGTLGFAGRSFALQEGRIRFNGGPTGDATVALRATETIDDVDVTVNVTGAATDPRISFSSSPGLPQDEIVSRILFGNSVGQLSAIQAVQLAASLNTLRGSGGGLNPLGKLRQIAGVDRLRILGPDDRNGRGTALAAGKYIGDDIYLEVITDARGFTATQLEVTLTRSLSILSQAGGSGGTNVNVRYRKNY